MDKIFNPDWDNTNKRLAFFLPYFIKAKWVAEDGNLMLLKEADLNLTPLGDQRLRELYHIQRMLFPEFFGKTRTEQDWPARAGSKAALDVILREINGGNLDVQQQEFLMAFARHAVKKLSPPEPTGS